MVQRNIPVVIENPKYSLYWLTTFFKEISHNFTFTAHQACAYGGERPKWTALAHTHPEFSRINKSCPGESSSHKLPSINLGAKSDTTQLVSEAFATAEETAYPMELAATIAPTGWEHNSFPAMKAITGHQPKASKLAPLVSEHKFTFKVQGPRPSMAVLPQQTMQRTKVSLPIPKLCSSERSHIVKTTLGRCGPFSLVTLSHEVHTVSVSSRTCLVSNSAKRNSTNLTQVCSKLQSLN